MGFDISVLQQKPNNWCSTSIEYEGQGVAEFQDPKGKIWGNTKIVFDEFGEYQIEMQVQGVESEEQLPLGLEQLLSGDSPYKKDGRMILTFTPSKNNYCEKLVVRTHSGEFIANDIEHHSHRSEHNSSGTKESVLFYPLRSSFDTENRKLAKYWVMPLVNFISDFTHYDPDLGNHPLRIFPDIVIPSDIPSEYVKLANLAEFQKKRLIIFEFNSKKGFIEALSDYQERKTRLLAHQISSTVTAVMVGEIGTNNQISLQELGRWFPLYLLNILGLATGSEVSTTWLEFRDEDGNLVRRVHGSLDFGRSLYIEGHRAINEGIHRGTGRLLTNAIQCTELRDSYLRVVLRHIILGGRHSQSVEDKLDHLCRALDALCKHYGISQQEDLLAHTQPEDKTTIQNAIRDSISVIRTIIRRAKKSGDFDQSRYLQTVVDRLSNVSGKELKFGLAVCDLLNKFNLSDANIMDQHYLQNPRKDSCKTWADVLSHYRGRVIHIGYFNIKENEHDLDDIWSVIQHLHDILLRIFFIILGYDQRYDPTVGNTVLDLPIDWVKSDTNANQLGYK